MRRAIRSRRVVSSEGVRPAALVYNDGLIEGVENLDIESGSMLMLDVGDLVILPGMVDTHIHVNEPGRSEWEGFTRHLVQLKQVVTHVCSTCR